MSKNEAYNSKQVDELLNTVSSGEANRIERRMLLAAKINDAIKANGFTKIAFAERMKKKPSVITKWLSGTHNFTTDTLFDIEEVLRIDLVNVREKLKLQSSHFHFVVNSICAEQKPWSTVDLFYNSEYSFLCTASGTAFKSRGYTKSGKKE